MTTIANTVIFEEGLQKLLGSTVKICVTQGEPSSVADCTSVLSATGKRISVENSLNGLLSIVVGQNSLSRKVDIPITYMSSGIVETVGEGIADLWLAVYDNTNVLLKTDFIANRGVTVGDGITTPNFSYEISQ